MIKHNYIFRISFAFSPWQKFPISVVQGLVGMSIMHRVSLLNCTKPQCVPGSQYFGSWGGQNRFFFPTSFPSPPTNNNIELIADWCTLIHIYVTVVINMVQTVWSLWFSVTETLDKIRGSGRSLGPAVLDAIDSIQPNHHVGIEGDRPCNIPSYRISSSHCGWF